MVRVLGKFLFNPSRANDYPAQDEISTEGEEEQIQANVPSKQEARSPIREEQKSDWNRETVVESRHGSRKEAVKDDLACKKFVRC
jgi:hypothetical protein